MTDSLDQLVALINKHHGICDKARLSALVAESLHLTKDRSVYYCAHFAVRFSSASTRSFSNTVLSLSNLQKFDDRPFVVCLVTPSENYCLIANTTFLKKISHSSQELRADNIRGSFNGSDIVSDFEGIANTAENIRRLYMIHAEIGFEGNLPRLVEATNNISPSGVKYHVTPEAARRIFEAPTRAIQFIQAPESVRLKTELDETVERFKTEILLAALIENVNVRGRVIEYLIAGEDESLRLRLCLALKAGDRGIPQFKTENALGDYHRRFDAFDTETDVKTKIMILNSNPKAYNLDKMLEFLSQDRSVFMFYFVGVDPGKIVNTVLVSMFQRKLLKSTIVLRHWAGRNSRGVTQIEGGAINELINTPDSTLNQDEAVVFLRRIVAL